MSGVLREWKHSISFEMSKETQLFDVAQVTKCFGSEMVSLIIFIANESGKKVYTWTRN